MRLARLLALTTALLTLTSCSSGGSPDQAMREIQSDFQNAGSIQFTSSVTADYGDRVFDFTVSYTGTGTDGVITIAEPASIAGATVTVSDGGAALSCGGAEVFTGEILPDGLSPVDAVAMMARIWSDGLVTETVREKRGDEDCLAALFRISDDVQLRAWFTEDTGLPLYAETTFDGYTVLTFEFFNVTAG